jgi:ParB-like chromosome segregation protein Spo0J
MSAEKFQLLPPLPPDQFEALKADIARRGVMVAVELDEYGAILDGHNRARACRELGINDFPTVVRSGLSDEEKRIHARKANVLRRHLTREQMRGLIGDQLKELPEWANNRLASALGVDDKTVADVRARMEATSEIPKLDRLIGGDGKSRRNRAPPNPRPKPPEGGGEEWSAETLAPAFGGKLLSDDPRQLPSDLKLALFEAGISAKQVSVISGSPFPPPFEGLPDPVKRDWALFALYLVKKSCWPADGAGEHVEWLRRNGWETPEQWLGDEGDRYRRSHGMNKLRAPLKMPASERWRLFAAEHIAPTFDEITAMLEEAGR